MRKSPSWGRLSPKRNHVNQPTSHVSQTEASRLLSLPNELLYLIVQEIFSFILHPDAVPCVHADWSGLTQSCRVLHAISQDMWASYYHTLPSTIDIPKWIFRRPNLPPKPHDRLTIYLQMPTFLRLPGEIRMPATRTIHYLNLSSETAWVLASHSDERFSQLPMLPVLKVIVWGPFGYASPWTMCTLHTERLEAYRSRVMNRGGFRHNARLWARWLPKCPQLQGAYEIRDWTTDAHELASPKSRKLAPELRAQSFAVVRRKIALLDTMLFELVRRLVRRRDRLGAKWHELVDAEVNELEILYLKALMGMEGR